MEIRHILPYFIDDAVQAGKDLPVLVEVQPFELFGNATGRDVPSGDGLPF
jgi:hypothetical protein